MKTALFALSLLLLPLSPALACQGSEAAGKQLSPKSGTAARKAGKQKRAPASEDGSELQDAAALKDPPSNDPRCQWCHECGFEKHDDDCKKPNGYCYTHCGKK